MKRKLWSLPILLVSLALGAAGTAPDFTGTWSLNVPKSDFSPANPPTKMTLKIEQDTSSMQVSTQVTDGLGDHSYNARYTFDGKQNENSQDGISIESSCVWDKAALVFSIKRGMNLQYKERWTISRGGKTLTIKRHTIYAHGEVNEKYIFDKQ
jgi:hypothetical protein